MEDRFKIIAIPGNRNTASLLIDLFDDRVDDSSWTSDLCVVNNVDSGELKSARELLAPHGIKVCRMIK